MNKPSERIVVFVTTAQKRAIAAKAEQLGISVSELMRRAVLAFSETSDPVKTASLVDRLNAPREPDALALLLSKAAHARRAPSGLPKSLLRTSGAHAAESDDDAHKASPAADADTPEADAIATTPNAVADGHGAAPCPVNAHADDADGSARRVAQAVVRLSEEAERLRATEALPDAPLNDVARGPQRGDETAERRLGPSPDGEQFA